MRYTLLLCGSIILFLLTACSFNYDEADIYESLDENIPDITLKNAKLVFVRGTSVTIEADKVEIYSAQQQQNMFNVKFSEVDANNNIRMKGRAEQIAIETENNNITMFGNIYARSNQDKAEITTEYLHWDDEKRIIEGSTVYPVIIEKDIGSRIEGYGFHGDAEKRELTIRKHTEGILVVDE